MMPIIETGGDNIPFIRLGSHMFRLDLEELEGDYKKRAEEEIRETTDNIEYGLSKFREVLLGKHHNT